MKRKSDKIRQQILNGAREVFLEKGFIKATMAKIAKESRVSPATLYNYFKSKQVLFDTLKLDTSYQEYQPEREQKRADIIRAALIMFGEKGYNATTLEAVMRKVNMSKTTLYNYFSNKEELFTAVLEASQVNLAARSFRMSPPTGDCEQLIRDFGQVYLDMGNDPTRASIFKTVVHQSASQPEFGRLYYQNGKASNANEISQYLKPFQEQGFLREDLDLKLSVMLFQFMVWAYNITYKYIKGADQEFTEEEALRHAVDIFFNGIRAK